MQEIKLIQADSFLTLHYRLTTQDGEEVVSTFVSGAGHHTDGAWRVE